jgi:hypothetical protein
LIGCVSRGGDVSGSVKKLNHSLLANHLHLTCVFYFSMPIKLPWKDPNRHTRKNPSKY